VSVFFLSKAGLPLSLDHTFFSRVVFSLAVSSFSGPPPRCYYLFRLSHRAGMRTVPFFGCLPLLPTVSLIFVFPTTGNCPLLFGFPFCLIPKELDLATVSFSAIALR